MSSNLPGRVCILLNTIKRLTYDGPRLVVRITPSTHSRNHTHHFPHVSEAYVPTSSISSQFGPTDISTWIGTMCAQGNGTLIM